MSPSPGQMYQCDYLLSVGTVIKNIGLTTSAHAIIGRGDAGPEGDADVAVQRDFEVSVAR